MKYVKSDVRRLNFNMIKKHYSKLRKSSFSFNRRYSTDAVVFSSFEPFHGSSEDLYTKKSTSILPRSSGQLLKTFGCQRSLTSKGSSFEKKAHRSKSLTQIDCLEPPATQRLLKGDGGGGGDFGGGCDLSGLRSGSTNPLTGSSVSSSGTGNAKCDSSPESGNPMLSDLHYSSDRLLVPSYHHSTSVLGIDDESINDLTSTQSTQHHHYQQQQQQQHLQHQHSTPTTSSSSILRFKHHPSSSSTPSHHHHHHQQQQQQHQQHNHSMLSHHDNLTLSLDQYRGADTRQDDFILTSSSRQLPGTNRKGYLEDTSSSISHDGTLKGSKGSRGQLARRSGGIFSNPFKTDREKMDQLTELLNQYSVHGIPEQMGLLSFKFDSHSDELESSSTRIGRENSIASGIVSTSTASTTGGNNTSNININNKQANSYDESLYLEDHWRCIVTSWESMPKKLQNQQDAIWELLHTEVFYIKRLKVISDLFLACLCNLQSECLLNDIDTEKMFSNITEVYLANHYFWMNHLLPMLKASRESHQPLNPIIMKDGFLKFEDIFHPYVKYCLEHSNCLQYVKEKHKESELFKAYVVWCETRKDCDRLRLMDLLVKPMQRLTKYSLLLKAILKKTEADEQKVTLKQMNESVERFVCRVDACLRRRHDQERLTSIVSRIESYDALDSSNDEVEKVLKEFTRLNLTCPMPGCLNHRIRQLLLEGSGLKFRDSATSSKLDVHCFLFTDILLICKSVGRKGDKVRVIRQPFLVDRIVTHELKDGSGFIVIYLNEFNVASAFFTLYTTETRTWVEHIKRSQDHYREAKQQSALYAANQSSLMYRSTVDGDDEDSDFPSTALLVTNTSPRSSRSSLMRSQSGSMDISDSTLALGSSSIIVPSTTPNLLSQNSGPEGEILPSRAISFELGELRNPSMTVDDVETFGRSHSMETRPPPISVTVTSPRPERRAFLVRGAGSERSYDSVYGSRNNTLSVTVPSLHVNNKHFTGLSRSSETSIQVPVLSKQSQFQQQHQSPPSSVKPSTSPPSSTTNSSSSSSAPRQRSVSPRSLQRSLPISSGYPAANKPPLVKMKNITGLKVHSAPPSEGPSPVHSFDSEAGIGEGGSCPSSSSCALVGVDTIDGYRLVSTPAMPTVSTTTSSSIGGYNTSIISIGEINNSSHEGAMTKTTMIINNSGDHPGGIISEDDLETVKSRLHQKRSVRGERRYHTADSIENIKKEKDSSIHKRLSWNFGQQSSCPRGSGSGNHGACSNSGSACGSGPSGGHDKVLCNKHFNKCLSSESVYTSSGFSSTGSVPLSVNSCDCEHCGNEVLSHIKEMEPSLESQQSSPIISYDHLHHNQQQQQQHSHSSHQQHYHQHHNLPPTSSSSSSHPSVTINERKDTEERDNLSSSSSSPRKIIITSSDSGNNVQSRSEPFDVDRESSKSDNPVIEPSDIKIDVSEVKDGISSVQITLSGTNIGKPSKSDLKKMKEFLLTSLEASEV